MHHPLIYPQNTDKKTPRTSVLTKALPLLLKPHLIRIKPMDFQCSKHKAVMETTRILGDGLGFFQLSWTLLGPPRDIYKVLNTQCIPGEVSKSGSSESAGGLQGGF